MRFSFLTAAAGLAAIVSAAPRPGNVNHVQHEKRNGEPHQWNKRERALRDEVLPVRIGLKQRNLEHVARFVSDVADPDSRNFGRHWSAEKVANTFAPHQSTKDAVMDWLADAGIHPSRVSLAKGHNWVEFDGTVAEAENLFKTEYWYYKHKESGGHRVACDEYSLPQHVQEHIDFVMPTIQLDGMKPVRNMVPDALVQKTFPHGASLGSLPCGVLITIDCLRALYNFPKGNSAYAGNELGIGEWADFLYLPDLPIFFKNFTRPQIPLQTKPDFISIDGGQTANLSTVALDEGIESALDFQSAYSIVYPQKIRLYQVGDGVNVDSVGTFNIFLDALDASYCTYQGGDQPYVDPAYPDPNEGGYTGPLQCGGAPKSNVMSFSYGQIEGALPYFYQHRQCNEWAKLALQGVSVLFASGDSGVANRYNAGYPDSCLNADEDYVDNNGTRFSPSFPVNCPYITAVGATTLISNDTSKGERAVSRFGSGGGFSNYFELPDYQASAVQNYLSKNAPNYGPNVWNQSGVARGFPDVAASGDYVVTVFNGTTISVGGTSASAPIVAGIVTLLNEQRYRIGKGPIGFLNPTFYKHPGAFNDITIGNNPGCGTPGFAAAKGWDPVTGLGTPNFQKLKRIFNALP